MDNTSDLLPIERLIFQPRATLIGRSVMLTDGLLEAIEQLDISEAAETLGTPINNLSARVLTDIDSKFGGSLDDIAEFAGRQCYRSWNKGRPQDEYIENVISEGHGSIFAHASFNFLITGVSRSLTHELVRHAIGTATSQESQRYVDAKDMMFVVPPIIVEGSGNDLEDNEELTEFRRSCQQDLNSYTRLQTLINDRLKRELADAKNEKQATSAKKRANEAARAALPNAAETRLVYSMSARAIWYITQLRGTEYADLEIRRLAVLLLEKAQPHAPALLNNIETFAGTDGLPALGSEFGGRI